MVWSDWAAKDSEEDGDNREEAEEARSGREKGNKENSITIAIAIAQSIFATIIIIVVFKVRSQQRLDKLAQRRKSREEVSNLVLGK